MINYPSSLIVEPLKSVPDCTIAVPGSKSITNRAMVLAALAEGESTLVGALDSEDTRVMADCLSKLGFDVAANPVAETIRIVGRGGAISASQADLFLGNSGTSICFLTALTALGNGTFTLDGVERMRMRPQQELITALCELGVDIRSSNNEHPGCPPLLVKAKGNLKGGTVKLNATASSQFLTALLMAAPYAQTDLTIEIVGDLRPFYVEITTKMMRAWGVETSTLAAPMRFHTRCGQKYTAQASYQIEPDASSASYMFGAAAVTGGSITVSGLGANALQGDVRFATDVLVEMGCKVNCSDAGITVSGPADGRLKGVDRDMSAISDTSLTLAAIAPFADSPTTIRNIAHARKQECDRISAACTELAKLGVTVEEREDGLKIWPLNGKGILPTAIETYKDHRVAMSMALIGLKSPGVEILDPGCVVKTFPDYWQRLDLLRMG